MNVPEAALVLAFAAAFDRRTVGEADARAWAAALHDVDIEDARRAVVDHYRETNTWLMPAGVIQRAREYEKQRQRHRREQHEGLLDSAPLVPPTAEVRRARAEMARKTQRRERARQ